MTTTMTPHNTSTRRSNSVRARRASILGAITVFALGVPAVLPSVAAAGSPPPVEAEAAGFDRVEIEAALERLRSAGMLTGETQSGLDAETERAAPWLAKLFGKKLLSIVLNSVGDRALDQVLAELGFDVDDDLIGALAQLGAAMSALQADTAEIQRQIEALLHGQDRANFYNSYTHAGLAAADIDTAMRTVGDWVAHDLDPSPHNVSDLATIVNLSFGQLDFMANNPVTGVVPLMMKAADAANVSDLVDYYADIDEVRDNYQAVFAQAIGALDLLVDFDHDGTISATRARLAEDAVDNTRTMFGYGIIPATDPVMGDQAIVHARNTDLVLSAWTDHLSGGTEWTQVQGIERSSMEPILSTMAAGYDPAHHDGLTLEEYLQARNIPTTFVYEDTVEQGVEPWTIPNMPSLRYVRYTMNVTFGEVRGNDYRESSVEVYKDDRAYRETKRLPQSPWEVDEAMKAEGDERYEQALVEARDGWRNMTQSWTGAHDAHGRVLAAPATTNVAGWATDYDPQRLEDAAFGHE